MKNFQINADPNIYKQYLKNDSNNDLDYYNIRIDDIYAGDNSIVLIVIIDDIQYVVKIDLKNNDNNNGNN